MWKEPAEILGAASIWAVTGNYGSGKTEISLNLALDSAKRGPTALVDLDIVNPYFRSAEREGMLREAGVRVLMPTYAMTTVDIPALPAEIVTVFERGESVWLDVGGDDTGAAALGRYKPQIDRTGAKMLFVINARRPLTPDADSILELIDRVCARARMQPGALCNNTNLGAQTCVDDILHGSAVVRDVAQRLGGIPAFHAVDAALADALPRDVRPFALPITPFMRPEWY